MFTKKNKKRVVEDYGHYRVIQSQFNNKYYVQKKVPLNIIFSKWITICIPEKNVENAIVIAMFGEYCRYEKSG